IALSILVLQDAPTVAEAESHVGRGNVLLGRYGVAFRTERKPSGRRQGLLRAVALAALRMRVSVATVSRMAAVSQAEAVVGRDDFVLGEQERVGRSVPRSCAGCSATPSRVVRGRPEAAK